MPEYYYLLLKSPRRVPSTIWQDMILGSSHWLLLFCESASKFNSENVVLSDILISFVFLKVSRGGVPQRKFVELLADLAENRHDLRRAFSCQVSSAATSANTCGYSSHVHRIDSRDKVVREVETRENGLNATGQVFERVVRVRLIPLTAWDSAIRAPWTKAEYYIRTW